MLVWIIGNVRLNIAPFAIGERMMSRYRSSLHGEQQEDVFDRAPFLYSPAPNALLQQDSIVFLMLSQHALWEDERP
jgi:hypothetical protein